MRQTDGLRRSCGECNACCKPFTVPEVDKRDVRIRCRHASKNGCSIYENRPLGCKIYACVWYNYHWPNHLRPDMLGTMIDMVDVRLRRRTITVLHLWEDRVGALNNPITQKLMDDAKEDRFPIATHHLQADGSYTHSIDITMIELTQSERTRFHEINDRLCI